MKIRGYNLIIPDDDPNVIDVVEKYGETHIIEAVLGTTVDMTQVPKGTGVLWGDGKIYHYRIYKKLI